MPDDQGSEETIEPTPEASAPEQHDVAQEKMFSQDEVNKLLAQQRRKLKSQQQAAQKEMPDLAGEVVAPILSTLQQLQARLDKQEQQQQEAEFDRHFRESGIPDKYRGLVAADFKVNKPADLPARLLELKGQLVVEQAPSAQAPAPNTATPGTSPTAVARDYSGRIDPLSLTAEDIGRLRSEGRLLEVMERYRTSSADGSVIFPKRRLKHS